MKSTRKIPFARDLDWERRFCFNPDIDYIALIEKYNRMVADNDQDGISKLLKEQQGRIALIAKAGYQKEMLEGQSILIVAE